MMNFQDKCLPPSNHKIIRWFKLDQFEPERAFTSHWVSSKWLFFIRLILTTYSTIVFWAYFIVMIQLDRFAGFFKAFTTMTFVGLHAYLVTATVLHFRYLISKSVDFIINQHASLNYLYLCLYSTVVTYNVLTPLIFWSVLSAYQSNADPIVAWINVSVHGVSFFLIFIDVILNRMVLPIRLILVSLGVLILYMVLAIIIYVCNNEWVYPFLSWDQGPIAAVWYLLIFGLTSVIFLVMVSVHFVRDWIAFKAGFTRIDSDSLTKYDTQ